MIIELNDDNHTVLQLIYVACIYKVDDYQLRIIFANDAEDQNINYSDDDSDDVKDAKNAEEKRDQDHTRILEAMSKM